MKNLTLLMLATITLAFGSNAFAAKEVFERTKIHVNVGSLGETDTPTLTLAIALAAGNPLEKAMDERTGTVTATIETERRNYEITTVSGGGLEEAKPSEAFFVRCDRTTMSAAQTREHILLARQVGVPVVVFLDVDGFANSNEVEISVLMFHELFHNIGYTESNSGVVAGSIKSALAGEKDGLVALVELIDTLDRCMGY
jgi:elongation factor Tu